MGSVKAKIEKRGEVRTLSLKSIITSFYYLFVTLANLLAYAIFKPVELSREIILFLVLLNCFSVLYF